MPATSEGCARWIAAPMDHISLVINIYFLFCRIKSVRDLIFCLIVYMVNYGRVGKCIMRKSKRYGTHRTDGDGTHPFDQARVSKALRLGQPRFASPPLWTLKAFRFIFFLSSLATELLFIAVMLGSKMIGPHLAGLCRKIKTQMLLGRDAQQSTTESVMGGEPRRMPPLEMMLPKMFERDGISIEWMIAIQTKEAGK
jgi:hypothetical protein